MAEVVVQFLNDDCDAIDEQNALEKVTMTNWARYGEELGWIIPSLSSWST